MNIEQLNDFDPNVQQALAELQAAISERWPTATFVVSRGQDDSEAIHLETAVDLDDPEEILDLVIDRVLDLQLEHGLPIHVILMQPTERILKEMQARRQSSPAAPSGKAAATS